MANAPGPFTTLDVLNNKFPCEGPEVVPLFLDFTTANTFDVDLKQLVQAQKISMVQSLFVDNADSTTPLIIVASITQQRLVIPAGCQAYIAGLFSAAQFTVSSSSLAKVKIYAQNFPVTNCVWGAGIATAQAVTVTNFPANQNVILTRAASNAFLPTQAGANLSVTVASQNVVIAPAVTENILLTNTGAGAIHVRFGTSAQTAVVTDLAIPVNGRILLSTNGATNMGVIGDAISTLNYIIGSGGI